MGYQARGGLGAVRLIASSLIFDERRERRDPVIKLPRGCVGLLREPADRRRSVRVGGRINGFNQGASGARSSRIGGDEEVLQIDHIFHSPIMMMDDGVNQTDKLPILFGDEGELAGPCGVNQPLEGAGADMRLKAALVKGEIAVPQAKPLGLVSSFKGANDEWHDVSAP